MTSPVGLKGACPFGSAGGRGTLRWLVREELLRPPLRNLVDGFAGFLERTRKEEPTVTVAIVPLIRLVIDARTADVGVLFRITP